MSYDVCYVYEKNWDNYEKRKLIEVEEFYPSGGTIPVIDTYDIITKELNLVPLTISECEVNITYNYSPFYYEHLDKELGIKWLHGKKGSECLNRLIEAVNNLGILKNIDPFWVINADYTIGQIFKAKEIPLPYKKEDISKFAKIKDWDKEPNELREDLIAKHILVDGGAYWKPTPGNAGNALLNLISWITYNDKGIFIIE